MTNAYTTAFNGTCSSFQFVSGTILSSARRMWVFSIGAGLALLAASLPATIGFFRNCRHGGRFPQQPEVRVGKDLDGLSEAAVNWVWAPQVAMLALSAAFFGYMFFSSLVGFQQWTPNVLRLQWRDFEKRCRDEPNIPTVTGRH